MTPIHWDTVTRLRRLYAQAMDPVCRRFGLTANEMGVLLFLGVRAGVNALVKAARKRNERKRIRKMLDKSEQKKWRYSDEDTAGDPDEDQEAAEPADTDKGSADQEAAEKEEEKDE